MSAHVPATCQFTEWENSLDSTIVEATNTRS